MLFEHQQVRFKSTPQILEPRHWLTDRMLSDPLTAAFLSGHDVEAPGLPLADLRRSGIAKRRRAG